jgi:cytochrome c
LTNIKEEEGGYGENGIRVKPQRQPRRSFVRHPLITLMWALAAATALAAVPAAAAGDAEKGAKVFKKCAACHVATEEKNKVGPHLVGIFGRPAASVEGYKYSDAMKASGIVWSVETLTAYVRAPKEVVPGGKMVFAGLKKDEEIADLLAFLEEATKKPD